jgi:cephalosporin hydroxylase
VDDHASATKRVTTVHRFWSNVVRPILGGAAQHAAEPSAHADSISVRGRRFHVSLGASVLARIQRGSLNTTWRGVPFVKSPFDIALYMELVGRLKPRTVIEIGTNEGGSALWFADALTAHGVETQVISIDLENPPPLTDDRIRFLRGDATRLEEVLSAATLAELPHPFLVTEDSAHTLDASLAVLEFFHPHLVPGDYIVIEDGIVGQLPGEAYQRYENGPNRAVHRFLEERGDAYEIDASLCDRYGRNVTWSPNGWLRRISH